MASVDRSRYGLGIEPRNRPFQSADDLGEEEGNIGRIAIARCVRALRGHRPHARTETSCTEPGRSRCWPRPVGVVRAAKSKVQPR